MGPFLAQLEQSGLATWIRESGVLYGYPLVLFLHTLGLSTVVGLSSAIDLRLLGIAPGIPLESLQKTFGLLWAGLALTALTGTLLFMSDAVKHASNPAFYVKLVFVVLVRHFDVELPLGELLDRPAHARVGAPDGQHHQPGHATAEQQRAEQQRQSLHPGLVHTLQGIFANSFDFFFEVLLLLGRQQVLFLQFFNCGLKIRNDVIRKDGIAREEYALRNQKGCREEDGACEDRSCSFHK